MDKKYNLRNGKEMMRNGKKGGLNRNGRYAINMPGVFYQFWGLSLIYIRIRSNSLSERII